MAISQLYMTKDFSGSGFEVGEIPKWGELNFDE